LAKESRLRILYAILLFPCPECLGKGTGDACVTGPGHPPVVRWPCQSPQKTRGRTSATGQKRSAPAGLGREKREEERGGEPAGAQIDCIRGAGESFLQWALIPHFLCLTNSEYTPLVPRMQKRLALFFVLISSFLGDSPNLHPHRDPARTSRRQQSHPIPLQLTERLVT
jgi:hypothetical protein